LLNRYADTGVSSRWSRCGEYRTPELDDDFRSNTHQGGIGRRTKLSPEESRQRAWLGGHGLPVCGVDTIAQTNLTRPYKPVVPASSTPELVTDRDVATIVVEYVERNAKSKPKGIVKSAPSGIILQVAVYIRIDLISFFILYRWHSRFRNTAP